MKAMIEYGNKKIEVDVDTIKISECKMCFAEFEQLAIWLNAISKISCFEE